MYNTSLYNQTLYGGLALESIFHYLLDGCYRSQPYAANRIMVIGKDSKGSPVIGAEESTAQLALVGERIDFRFTPHLATEALAEQMAAAALAKARLDAREGFITLPPNCGVELWDVITVYDELCSQQARSYRVVGIRLAYHPADQQYYQQLSLGEV